VISGVTAKGFENSPGGQIAGDDGVGAAVSVELTVDVAFGMGVSVGVAAKPSIGRSAPREQRVTASKRRGLK
jgi:hypothetical protein